jgi:hypothetical protein
MGVLLDLGWGLSTQSMVLVIQGSSRRMEWLDVVEMLIDKGLGLGLGAWAWVRCVLLAQP